MLWSMSARRQSQAIADELHRAYALWRSESLAVGDAYVRWRDAEERARPSAFARYTVQLEREAAAAERYRAVI